MGVRSSDYESYVSPAYTTQKTGSRLDLNSSPMDSPSKNPIYEDRVNSVLRKYPKYSSGQADYGGSAAAVTNLPSNSLSSFGPGASLTGSSSVSAVQKSRSYSNFDSLKRTDLSNINTLGQVSTTVHKCFATCNQCFTLQIKIVISTFKNGGYKSKYYILKFNVETISTPQ